VKCVNTSTLVAYSFYTLISELEFLVHGGTKHWETGHILRSFIAQVLYEYEYDGVMQERFRVTKARSSSILECMLILVGI
jgi:hypothetical protein